MSNVYFEYYGEPEERRISKHGENAFSIRLPEIVKRHIGITGENYEDYTAQFSVSGKYPSTMLLRIVRKEKVVDDD